MHGSHKGISILKYPWSDSRRNIFDDLGVNLFVTFSVLLFELQPTNVVVLVMSRASLTRLGKMGVLTAGDFVHDTLGNADDFDNLAA